MLKLVALLEKTEKKKKSKSSILYTVNASNFQQGVDEQLLNVLASPSESDFKISTSKTELNQWFLCFKKTCSSLSPLKRLKRYGLGGSSVRN